MTTLYSFLVSLGNQLRSPLLLICRLYWGSLLVSYGWSKLNGIEAFEKTLEGFHIGSPLLAAYAAACAEFFGGFCLGLGWMARLATIPLIITMMTAYATVHHEAFAAFFNNPSLFVAQPPFNFLLTALFVLACGPGFFSLDRMQKRD